MKYSFKEVGFEVTRRCNLKCDHCMRGQAQNVNMTPDMVDAILNNEEISHIESILFSGGEPTLNPGIIVYTIDKIIRENIDVREVCMVTNGKIFSREIVEAFNRFNEYRNRRVVADIKKIFGEGVWKTLIDNNINNHARITFSTDKYHEPISKEIVDSYKELSDGIKITFADSMDERLLKTGRSKEGKEYNYSLIEMRYISNEDECDIVGDLYISALGNVTNNGDGSYEDMDKNNFGSVYDFSIEKILSIYGIPVKTISIDDMKAIVKQKVLK
jgi:MoaA/NifB/PqqE/SkfB family radical SAM enzyme